MMNFPQFGFRRDISVTVLGPALLVLCALGLAAQHSPSNATDIQREAMRKLNFLVGRWTGPVTVVRGPGEPLHLTQTEDVESRLDGLVLLIDGKSAGADGSPLFQALATIGFDEATHTYRFRAYNEGHYVDTELTVVPDGFSWGFAAGPAHIVNTMHLTGKGQWQEATEVAVGDNPPRKSVDMLLERQP
jgi:hypothetical protein